MTTTKKRLIPQGYLFTRGYTNYIFLLLFLLYMFDYIDRVIVSSMFTSIQKDLGITNTQSGLLVSAVYWSIVVLTIPISVLVDRWSRRKTIGIMAFLWSIATALCALTGNYTQLLFARILIGVGEAGYAPGGTAMISGLYPQEKRAQMMGLWNASIPLGSAIGVALGGIIASHWGWKHAFGLVAIPGMVIAILFFFIKDYKTVDLSISQGKAPRKKMKAQDVYHEFINKPSLIYTILGIASVVFVTTAMLTWLSKYFQSALALTEKMAGLRASLVMLLAIIGAPLGGYLSDLWRNQNPRARLLFPTLSTALSAVLLSIAFYFTSGLFQYIVLLIFGISVMAFIPAAATVTQDVVHAGLRAVSYSFAVFAQNLVGASIAPVAIGVLIDATNIETAMNILPAILGIGALLFFVASRYYLEDMKKVEKIQLEAIES
jgi:predicted MFS family arabinose efflux permease